VFLDSQGQELSNQEIGAGTGGFTNDLVDGDYFGWDVDGAGDIDADGIVDIIVGCPTRDAAYLIFLQADGTVKSAVTVLPIVSTTSFGTFVSLLLHPSFSRQFSYTNIIK